MHRQQDVTVVQDVTCEAQNLVTAVREALASRVGAGRAELWFGRRARLAIEADRLVVEVPNEFYRDWLRRHFREDLLAAAMSVPGCATQLEFRINVSASEGELATAQPVFSADNENELSNVRRTCATAAGPCSPHADHPALRLVAGPGTPSRVPGSTGQPGNQAEVSRRRPLAEMADFVVGPSNRLAYASAEMTIRNLGCHSPLLIHGPTGVGKTHLLEAICSAAARTQPRICAVYQTAEQFTSEFLESLRHSGLPSFRRKYRGVDVLVLDDVQFLAGKRATLVEMLHTLDTLVRQGRQVVLAADRPAAELHALGPELTARLSGGMACGIVAPDFDVRLGIVRQAAARLQIDLADDVANRVAARLSQHARQLIGAVHRLKAFAELAGGRITAALADEALADLTASVGRGVQLSDIERAICDEFQLESDALRSQNKTKVLAVPRALAMWLARKHTRSALSEIGNYFGRRSHTTVLAAHKRVEGQMACQKVGEHGGGMEEAIRRVERRLRVG